MRHYKLSSKADVDISKIYRYGINKFGISIAKSYLLGLHNISDKLIFYKELWRPSFQIINGLYKYNYKSHVIFFTAEDDYIFIIRILQKNMDFEIHL
mgnify:FL=1